MTSVHSLLRRIRGGLEFRRSYASALFIPGSKASETFSLFTPYLDPEARLGNLEKLKRELELRGSEIDAEGLAKTWRFYKYISANRNALESRRREIAENIKRLGKKGLLGEETEKEIAKLTMQGKLLKQEVKSIRDSLWEMEEDVIPKVLSLPNELHERTPHGDSVILSIRGEKLDSDSEVPSHLEIGASLGLIDYRDPLTCYLCEEAALFELAVLSWAGETLTDSGMTRMAGTDFARSLVLEGSGIDHEDRGCSFVLRNNEDVDAESPNRLHLVGSASLASFLAMHTKQLVNPNDFPLRYFSSGRHYKPDNDGGPGLLGVSQSSVIHAFVAVKDPQDPSYDEEFQKLDELIGRLYDNLEIHYRKVLRSAKELGANESLRISYELWSPHSRSYVEVGHVSMCGKFLSERLLFAYQTPTGRNFPAVINATVISVQRLLACLLEIDPQKFRVPDKIFKHMRFLG